MKIGIKLRCYHDSQLKQLIHQTAGNNRFIYNYFLNLKKNKYQENKTSLSYQDCSALLPSLKNSVFAFIQDNSKPIDFMTISGHDFNLLKRNYFLKSGFSTSIQFALKSLDNAFNNFFKSKGKVGYPQFKKKNSADSITITPNNWKFVHIVTNNRLPDLGSNSKTKDNIKNSIIDNCGKTPSIYDYLLYFSGCDKPLKIQLDGRDFNPATISKINLSYNAAGQYFITFLADEDIHNIKFKNILKNNDNYLKLSDPATGEYYPIHTSIDLGIKNTLNIRSIQNNVEDNSNGKLINQSFNKNNYLEKKLQGLNRYNKKLRRYQQSLSRKKKGSCNYNKQKIKVAKLHQKMVNIRTDFYHKESTKIVLESDKIMVESLNIKGMVKNKNMAKSISQQGWGQFITMLKYKSQWYGKTLIEVDRFYPSSKICSACKQYNSNIKKQDQWVCQYCKVKHQRDENATKNLLEYESYTKVGKKYIYNHNQNKSSKNQAELKNINNKKLPESSGEIKTVEMYKTNNIPSNIIGNINEAVNASL